MIYPSETPELLTLKDVSFSRNDRPILNGISFGVRAGELVIITGRSGSGKTSLLKLAAGLLQPNRGRLQTVASSPDTDSSNALPRVGFVRQEPANQLIAGTVEEEVSFALSLANLPPEDIKSRVDSALQRTGLQDVRQQSPHTLSGGMMQRLAIACALATSPRLWLFDEPTAYLDPPSRVVIQRMAMDVRRAGAVLFVASDPYEWSIGDRLLVLHEGRLVADGHPDEVMSSKVLELTGLSRHQKTHVWPTLFKVEDLPKDMSVDNEHLPESLKPWLDTVPSAESGDLPLLQARGLVASRAALMSASREVLHGINLEIGNGECVALIGPAGAGKTSLLEVLAELSPLDSGEIIKHSVDQPDAEDHCGVSLAFQFPERQFFSETVLEEVAYGVRNSGISNPEANDRALEALFKTGLSLEYTGRSPFELSGGEARRVALAVALALHPRLLMLDEPTAGLDSVDADRIGEIIAVEVEADRKSTRLNSSHTDISRMPSSA